MLQSAGVEYVILGHSERREYFNETSRALFEKLQLVLQENLIPIFCCGEKLDEREAGQHFAVVEKQVAESLYGLEAKQVQQVVIAYEPVWAIGTGKTATSEQAQEMHAFIRGLLAGKYGSHRPIALAYCTGVAASPQTPPSCLRSPMWMAG
jgi:triosephosphate isomerase